MIPFTDRVAAAIIEQGIPLHQLTVIVPSERMIAYMQRALFSVDDQPKLSNNPNSNITLSKSIPLSFSSSTSTSILSRASQVSSSPSPALVISTFKTKPESSTLPAEQKEFMKTRFKSSLLLEFPVSDIVYNFVNSPTGKFEGTEVVAVIAEEVAPAARFDMQQLLF